MLGRLLQYLSPQTRSLVIFDKTGDTRCVVINWRCMQFSQTLKPVLFKRINGHRVQFSKLWWVPIFNTRTIVNVFFRTFLETFLPSFVSILRQNPWTPMQHSRIRTSSSSKNSKSNARDGDWGVAGHRLWRKNVTASGSHEHSSIPILCWFPTGSEHASYTIINFIVPLWATVTYPSCQYKQCLSHRMYRREDAQHVLVSSELWTRTDETYHSKYCKN